jgi:hypothetical protein
MLGKLRRGRYRCKSSDDCSEGYDVVPAGQMISDCGQVGDKPIVKHSIAVTSYLLDVNHMRS